MKRKKELTHLRTLIDHIDTHLLKILAERGALVKKISALKAARGMPPRDLQRERRILSRIRSAAKKSGLHPIDIEHIYKIMFRAARRTRTKPRQR